MFGAADQNFKPVQLYQLNGLTGVNCRVLQSADAFIQCIHYYWVLEISAQHVDLPVIPDNAVDLVLSPESKTMCALYFPQAEKFEISLVGPATYVGSCFHIQHLPRIFNQSIEALRELAPGAPSAQALELDELIAEIQGVESDGVIQELLDRHYASIDTISGGSSEASLFAEFADRLEPATVKTLATSVGLSERQFRRLAVDHFGLSPKKLQRVMRLQQALNKLIEEELSPLDEGYYDDSHKIRELKKLTGLTPTEIRRMAEIYNQSVR